jgi:thymidylate kinase
MQNGPIQTDDQRTVTHLMAILGYTPSLWPATRLRAIRNPDGSLRWVWPDGQREPLFLAFYSATTLRARVFVWLVQLVFMLRVQRLFFRLVPVGFGPLDPTDSLTAGAPFALFMGTPGPYRKAVCCFREAAGQLLFAKLPLTAEAARKVRAETATLLLLALRPATCFTMPRVVTATADRLVQTSVGGPEARRAAQFGPAHAAFLRDMQRFSQTQPLQQTAFWQTTERQVWQLWMLRDQPGTRLPYGLLAKLQRLALTVEPTQPITTAFAHGDFTPWNCWLTPTGLAIYDLEFALPAAPLLHDLFHFQLQQGILVNRWSAERIRTEALRVAGQYFPEIPVATVERAFRLYLLHQISTFALVYHAQPQWHAQVWWLLQSWNDLLTLELRDQLAHRQLALFDLLDDLRLTDSEALVLKSRTASPYLLGPTSDLDLLVDHPTARRTRQLLQRMPLLRHASVQHHPTRTAVNCWFRDGSFLSVDLVNQLARKNLLLTDRLTMVRQARRSSSGLLVPGWRDDFESTLLFYWLNHSALPASHLHYFEQLPAAGQQQLLAHLTARFGLTFGSLAEAGAYSAATEARVRQVLQKAPENQPIRRWLRGLSYVLGTAASWFQTGGMLISFSGVDGAGKSTVIGHVQQHLEKQWRRRVVVVRHRPSLLPILSAWKYGKAAAEARSVQSLPRQGSNTSWGSSVGRFAYYYLDYVVGQGLIWLKHTSRGHVVLYDRYYFDFIHDGRRSNIELPVAVTQALYALVAKPRLNFFLYAAPDVILRRKQELPSATIVELTTRYLTLFQQLGTRSKRARYVPIENHDLPTTLGLIDHCISEEIQ